MAKQYTALTIPENSTYKDIFSLLVSATMQGRLVYCDINGQRLFSDTVSIDDVSLAVTGKSFYQHLADTSELTLSPTALKWCTLGRKYIKPPFLPSWDKTVTQVFADSTNPTCLGQLLKAVGWLNQGEMGSAADILTSSTSDTKLLEWYITSIKGLSELGSEFETFMNTRKSLLINSTEYFK